MQYTEVNTRIIFELISVFRYWPILLWLYVVKILHEFKFSPHNFSFQELLPLAIVLLYPIVPLIKKYRQGFRGNDLYKELFEPSETWYVTQMDRRKAEYFNNAEGVKMDMAFDNKAFESNEKELLEMKNIKESERPEIIGMYYSF